MLSERDTDAFKKWYASATLNHDDGSACYMAWCAALVEERKRAQRDAALKARVEAAEGLLREVSEFIDTESRVVKALAERAQQIAGRIDAALQAAMESTEPKGS